MQIIRENILGIREFLTSISELSEVANVSVHFSQALQWTAGTIFEPIETARSRAERFFGSPGILLERFIERARHVEVQILGLADGRVVALGERDCSVQRRHQKVAEETPSPGRRPPGCARGCWPRPSGPGRRSATAAPGPSSAWSTPDAGCSCSWR